jgi:RNA polymerase sigma factor (sigma-70 family)
VRLCLAGNDAAWRRLVWRYRRLVYAIPRRHGLAPADCDDVFQETFAALLRQIGTLRDRQSLARWLITTASRRAWRVLGERPGAALPDGAPPEDAIATPPDDSLERLERRHLVHAALERLGGRCAELLSALYLDRERPGYGEISRRLAMPPGSIGPTRARCLVKLLEIMRAMGVEGPR